MEWRTKQLANALTINSCHRTDDVTTLQNGVEDKAGVGGEEEMRDRTVLVFQTKTVSQSRSAIEIHDAVGVEFRNHMI
jgi:hypothetical protein